MYKMVWSTRHRNDTTLSPGIKQWHDSALPAPSPTEPSRYSTPVSILEEMVRAPETPSYPVQNEGRSGCISSILSISQNGEQEYTPILQMRKTEVPKGKHFSKAHN